MASQDDQSGRPQAGASSANTNGVLVPEVTSATRRADELARKDRTLAEFMLMLDDYEPLVSSSRARQWVTLGISNLPLLDT